MNKLFCFIFIWGFVLSISDRAYAQCNTDYCPPGYPIPAVSAPAACILCSLGQLDNYTNVTGPLNAITIPAPFCSGVQNNQWFAFEAPQPTVEFFFEVNNCFIDFGLQVEIYSTVNCTDDFVSVSNCWNPGTTANGTVTAENLIPGEVYYLMIDGYDGDVCQYTITVVDPPGGGGNGGILPPPGPINGDVLACTPGATYTYEVPILPEADEYIWTITPPNSGIITSDPTQNIISINWIAAGVATLCVQASNTCNTSPTTCVSVTVEPVLPTSEEHYLCIGESVTCAGQTYYSPGFYQVTLPSYLGCDSVVNCIINPLLPVSTDLGKVTICAPDEYQICNSIFDQSGSYNETCVSYLGCDSIVSVDLFILEPVAVIQPPDSLGCDSLNLTIILDGSASTLAEAPNSATSFLWSGPGICGLVDSVITCADLPGIYCLELIHERGGVSCSDTTCVEVILNSQIPPAPQISGPTEPCIGVAVQYTVSSTGQPQPTGYSWTTSDNTLITVLDSATIEVTWLNTDSVQLCATADNECGSNNVECINIYVTTPPTAELSGFGSICQGSGETVDLTLNFTGTPPWKVVFAVNNDEQAPLIFSDSLSMLTLGEPQAGSITLISVEDGIGCSGTVSGEGNIAINTAPMVSNIQYECDSTNTKYVVTFEIIEGDSSSYEVSPPEGILIGNTFTSDPINSGNGYSFMVSDMNDCDSFNLSDAVICNCTTQVGEMDLGLIEECGDGPITAFYDGNHVFDGNDSLVFVLHSGNGNTTVPPILGFFSSPMVSFNGNLMSYGTTYYLSAVVGDADGAGGVFLNDHCLAVAPGTPIVFHAIPDAALSGGQSICTGEQAVLTIDFTGNNPWSITYDNGLGLQTINNIDTNVYSLILSPATSTTICLTEINDAFCAGTVSGCAEITVNTAVEVSPPAIECNQTGTGYTVSFLISGGDTSSYLVTPAGILSGGAFTSNEIPDSIGFSFLIDDANSCSPQIIEQAEVECNCLTLVGGMTADLIEICGNGSATTDYDSTNEFLDPNDQLIFILHTNSSDTIGTILATSDLPAFDFDSTQMNYGTSYFISAVAGNDDGTGGVDLSDPCVQVANGTPVIFYEIPTATLSGPATICEGKNAELQIAFTGSPVWELALNGQVLSGIASSDLTYSVSPDISTVYSLSDLSNEHCLGQVFGTLEVIVNTAPIIVNEMDECDPDTNTYTMNFEIEGGDASTYNVFPMFGTLSGNQFVSDPILSNQFYEFILSDANGCGQDTVSGILDCDCMVDAGLMSTTAINACVGEIITAPVSIGAVLNTNDILLYFLHTGNGDQLENVIAQSNVPVFNFDGGMMTAGLFYYISAVVGSDDGSGGIDFGDPCQDIAPGTPVFWNPLPQAMLDLTDAVCSGDPANVTISMSGTGPYNLEFNLAGNLQTASDISSPYIFEFFPTTDATISTISVTDLSTGCSDVFPDVQTVIVSQAVEAGQTSGTFSFCDQLDTTIQLAQMLAGADSGGIWTDSTGNIINGGTFQLLPFQPGTHSFTYFVTATPPCQDDEAIVEVIIAPHPVADAGEDSELGCGFTEVVIGGVGTTSGAFYQWTGGNVVEPNNRFTETFEPGNYILTVTNQFGCTDNDEVLVVQNVTFPEPDFTVGEISCFGENDGFITIDSIINGQAPYLYSFGGSPFSEQNSWSDLFHGTYSIIIQDGNGCENSIDVILEEPEQVSVELQLDLTGNENIMQYGDSTLLTALVTPDWDSLDIIVWTPDELINCDTCQTNYISPTEQTTFSILINENGCFDEDELSVLVNKNWSVFIPNAFSPNSDGFNDVFYIFAGKGVVKIRSFLVFDRWGSVMWEYYNFQPNDLTYGWDGTNRGQLQNTGVFTWFAEIEFLDGSVNLFEGDVMLLR